MAPGASQRVVGHAVAQGQVGFVASLILQVYDLFRNPHQDHSRDVLACS